MVTGHLGKSVGARAIWALAALSLVWFAACGDDGDGGNDEQPNNAVNNDGGTPEGVRIFHSMASSPGDLRVVFRGEADDVEFSGVRFREARAYEAVPAGIYTVLIFDDSGTALSELAIENLNIDAGTARTLFISEDANGNARVTPIPDSLEAPGENQSRVRFLHQASATGVDIINQADGERLAQRIEHGQLTNYTNVPGAEYDFEVFAEDTVTDPLASVSGVPLLPGVVYSIVIVGQLDPNGDGDTSDRDLTAVQLTDADFN